jgi:psiF repeat-containing protein
MTASQPGIFAMIRFAVAAGLLTVMLGAPSFAVTSKEKMATCKFGADDQKLAGAQRAKFIKDCMANRNDPRGGAGAMGTMGPTAAPSPKN